MSAYLILQRRFGGAASGRFLPKLGGPAQRGRLSFLRRVTLSSDGAGHVGRPEPHRSDLSEPARPGASDPSRPGPEAEHRPLPIDALESGGRDAAPRRILSHHMRPVRCGGEAACRDRAMGWVLAPLRNADRADRSAGERTRKLVARPIWAGPVGEDATWRAGQSAETSFSSGGEFSWAGLVLHHPRRLASFLRTLATGRTAPCPSRVRQPPAGRRAFAPSCLGSTACPGSMAREACGAFAAFPSKGGRQGQAAVSGRARHRAGREPGAAACANTRSRNAGRACVGARRRSRSAVRS